jgi:hypothetical protein
MTALPAGGRGQTRLRLDIAGPCLADRTGLSMIRSHWTLGCPGPPHDLDLGIQWRRGRLELVMHLAFELIDLGGELSQHRSERPAPDPEIGNPGGGRSWEGAKRVDERDGHLESLVVEHLRGDGAELLQLATRSEDSRQVPRSIGCEPFCRKGERTDGFEVGMPADRNFEVHGGPALEVRRCGERLGPVLGIPSCDAHPCNSTDQPASEHHGGDDDNLPPRRHSNTVASKALEWSGSLQPTWHHT